MARRGRLGRTSRSCSYAEAREGLVPSLEGINARTPLSPARREQRTAVQLLYPVLEHRSDSFIQTVPTNLHHRIGADAHQIMVEGSVVNLAHRQSIRDDGTPALAVRNDVCSVKEFRMVQRTYGASLPVGGQHLASERRRPARCFTVRR